MELKEKISKLFEVIPVMTRDQLTQKFFSEYLNPTWKCQTVMRQLHQEKKIIMNTKYRPFLCFSKSKKIPQYSSKLWHHVDVVQFYLDHNFQHFDYEPFLGYQKDGFPRPDAFIKWFDKAYFVELQTDRKHWTKEEVKEKIKRYEKAYAKKKYLDYSPTEPMLWFVNQSKVDVYSQIKIRWQ